MRIDRRIDTVGLSATGPSLDTVWAAFCETVEERIEAIRSEEAPLTCPECGSTTPDVNRKKWCPPCQAYLPIAQFCRERRRRDGRRDICRFHDGQRVKAYRARLALRVAS